MFHIANSCYSCYPGFFTPTRTMPQKTGGLTWTDMDKVDRSTM